MAQKKITQRWLTGSLGVILVILVIVEIAVWTVVRTFYYSSAQQTLLSQANTVNTLLAKYAEDPSTDYQREVRNLVENFELRDRMELMAVDAYGNVTSTSSGFAVNEKIEMPDFEAALASPDRMGSFQGELGGEKIIAISSIAPVNDESLVAVRLVASLTKVDGLIYTVVTMAVLAGIAIIFFMLLSGSYFISSIVIPVGEIGKTARKIAHGNFSTRLEKKNDDEIGDLCEAINYMAEELGNTDKMKNEFISSVSHELRTPLTAIKGWSETILDAGDDRETIQKGMRVIISETDRLSLMVEELLDFSRMQSGRLKLIIEKIDLLAELEEAVLMYTEKARREQLDFQYEERLEAAIVMADKNRLRQVFINIIDNAIKYSDAGGKIRILAAAEGDYFVVSVSDTGCGISPEDLPKIKQKFYKANLTRRGSGIGLAVADELVSSFGGSIDVQSTLGEGTTVTIRIPNVRRYEIWQQAQQTPGKGGEEQKN
ncbi:sensor histidine kinase [Yanshouia hominis]|uniref:histidine kinase n=1 Tax=Yanshouia hominis TaxID=2763673 RepID=A0ABR7NNF5_9FIRM|nr:HAMP domain-containing sensor histidine kinase [Yanshouia hominis]MBC8577168.1 HAMP domain-containing histidine kinase [Yanshouia hominis]